MWPATSRAAAACISRRPPGSETPDFSGRSRPAGGSGGRCGDAGRGLLARPVSHAALRGGERCRGPGRVRSSNRAGFRDSWRFGAVGVRETSSGGRCGDAGRGLLARPVSHAALRGGERCRGPGRVRSSNRAGFRDSWRFGAVGVRETSSRGRRGAERGVSAGPVPHPAPRCGERPPGRAPLSTALRLPALRGSRRRQGRDTVRVRPAGFRSSPSVVDAARISMADRLHFLAAARF